MRRVGIGGALVLDVNQGTPPGPMKFMDADWQAMPRHTVLEAKRLEPEINLNNGIGYCGSGGAWIAPEVGMQSVVQTKTPVHGGRVWAGVLPKAGPGSDYRDIAVMAVAESNVAPKDRFAIPAFAMKGLQWYPWVAYRGIKNPPLDATAPASAIIARQHIVDLTARMAVDGLLMWNVPPREWTILQLGQQFNGHMIEPAPAGQGDPETDKLSRAATDFYFNYFGCC